MELSKIYEDSKNIKINFSGKKIDKIRYEALENLQSFWHKQAKELVWFKDWDKVLDWNPPYAKWFVGGKINASVNCLDKHVNSDRKNKVAIIWEGENGDSHSFTYYQLYLAVNRFANALKNLGISKGDRITIYLPMVPELIIAVLACARIGAIHNVVFSGFSSKALADRINDAGSKIVITSDGGYRRGKFLELKKLVDQAIQSTPSIKNVVVLRRTNNEINLNQNDVLWSKIVKDVPSYCPPEELESTHPLFILYTSGTTGKPKGVVHGTGGYLTHIYSTAKWVFEFNDQDIFFCTADIGWVTGHSYIAYAPLMHGVTQIIYEGAPDYPHPDRYWSIVEKHGATILYTTPTALRMYMKHGDDIPNSFDLSTIRLLGTVGEPINPEVWLWYFKIIGKEKCLIVDTWWQTETGGILISKCPGLDNITMKPGSATLPIPGIDIVVVDEEGKMLENNKKGYLVIRKPWPGMLMTLWNDNEKYENTYWKKFDNVYFAGDYAVIDNDNYLWLLGRSDDVLKVAGHRLGAMELESAFVSHESVAEAAVTSKPDKTKGESINAFVVLRSNFTVNDNLKSTLMNHIRNNVGPIAIPDKIYFVDKLPKTRSGKIMRRLLKSICNNSPITDISTLEDESSIDEIKKAYNEMIHEIIEKKD